MLTDLLHSLGRLTFPRQDRAPDIRVVVIDNDVERSAAAVVERVGGDLPWPIRYDVEPVRNISLARNRAVRLALADGAEQVAFVDDDEVATPEWLDTLLDVGRRHGADAVFGPVRPRFPEGVAPWVVQGDFFCSERHATGDTLTVGNTCNVLASARLFAGEAPGFDPRFGTSGGGDTHFFMRASRAGARLVWADEAWVEELIPLTRARAGWIIRRSFRIGHAYIGCRRDLLPLHRWLLPSAAAALARIGLGLLLLPLSLPRGRAGALHALRKVGHGAGALAGIAGLRYHEYRTTHGN